MIHIEIKNYTLKDLDNIYILSQMLAHYFPKPEECVTGIYELLLNAVEHGNLEVGFKTKASLVRTGKWKEEILRRLSLPEYANRKVDITLTNDMSECKLVIADEGNGFNWREYIDRPLNERCILGRGLFIAFNSRFDHVTYNPEGNEVTCVSYNIMRASDVLPHTLTERNFPYQL